MYWLRKLLQGMIFPYNFRNHLIIINKLSILRCTELWQQ